MSLNVRRSLCLAFILLGGPVLATVVADEAIEVMAARVPIVVRARVLRSEASWDDAHRRIWTRTELEVTERLKGRVGKTIRVQQPGGEVGEMGQLVAGAARFAPGEDCLLFLEPSPDQPELLRVSGLAAGKIRFGRHRGVDMAMRELDGLALVGRGGKVAERLDGPQLLGSPAVLLARLRSVIGGAR